MHAPSRTSCRAPDRPDAFVLTLGTFNGIVTSKALERVATPDEVAHLAVFLSSDKVSACSLVCMRVALCVRACVCACVCVCVCKTQPLYAAV